MTLKLACLLLLRHLPQPPLALRLQRPLRAQFLVQPLLQLLGQALVFLLLLARQRLPSLTTQHRLLPLKQSRSEPRPFGP